MYKLHIYSLWRTHLNWWRFARLVHFRVFMFLMAIFLIGENFLPIRANAAPPANSVYKGCSAPPSIISDDAEIMRLIGGSIIADFQFSGNGQTHYPFEIFSANDFYGKGGGRQVINGNYKVFNSLIIIDAPIISENSKVRNLLRCGKRYFFSFPKSKNNDLTEINIKKTGSAR